MVNGQIIGKFIDNLACRRTSNNGVYGECIPRRCCRSISAVRNLCLTSTDHVCCYGENMCQYNGQRLLRPLVDRPDIGSYPERGISDYCERFVVRRIDWDAAPSTKRPYRMPVRVDNVIIHHTGDYDDQCWSLEQCRQRLRRMQLYYQREKQFPDIPWNFLISNNGDIYEGVGWDNQGYHTENWNDRSIGIAFIGDYDRESPSLRALRALTHLLDCGIEHRVLDRNYQLQGHRDMRPTGCPGDYLYASLRKLKSGLRNSGNSLNDGNNFVNQDDSYDFQDFIDDEFLSRTDYNSTIINERNNDENNNNNKYSDAK